MHGSVRFALKTTGIVVSLACWFKLGVILATQLLAPVQNSTQVCGVIG